MSSANKKRKLEIESDLKKDPSDARYSFFTPIKMKSNVWKNLQQVKFQENIESFARCNNCKELVSYSPKSGTGSLLRHTCTHFAYVGGSSQTGGASSSSESLIQKQTLEKFYIKKLPEKVKNMIKMQQVSFIVKDLRPLSITEGVGFKNLAQSLIKIGADYGYQNIDDILVSRRTLTRTVIPEEYDKIKNQLEVLLSSNHLAFTTDMRTDEYTQRGFLTLTTHYVSEDFNLKTNVLGTREFTLGEKTGDNIRDCVLEILTEFKIEDKLKHGVIVTDNGSNVVAAFRNYKRLSCACHNLNLVMEDVLEKNVIEELKVLIQTSKKLVAFFKHSELNSKLSKSLKQHNKTRWNSLYIMLASIFEMYLEIQKTLMERNELHYIASINYNLLQHVLEFLSPFKECSEKLSSDTIPVIQEYVLWFHKLMKHCLENPTDSEVITELKANTLISLKKRFQPTAVHNVAVFFNPPYKQLKFMSEEDRAQIIATVKAMLEEYKQDEDTRFESKIDNVQALVPGSSANVDLFDEFRDKNDDNDVITDVDRIQTEIEMYMKKNVSNCSILQFWREAVDLPRLRGLSRQVLNIPPSSATSERIFSTSGRILEERRTRLSSENVDQILFLNKNL